MTRNQASARTPPAAGLDRRARRRQETIEEILEIAVDVMSEEGVTGLSLAEVARRDLNVSEAAEALHTSQPGVSKQIKALEEELGIQVFARHGKRLVSVTEPGKAVMALKWVVREMENRYRAMSQ